MTLGKQKPPVLSRWGLYSVMVQGGVDWVTGCPTLGFMNVQCAKRLNVSPLLVIFVITKDVLAVRRQRAGYERLHSSI